MTTRHHRHKYPLPPSLAELGLEPPPPGRRSGAALPKPKRLRFQLLAEAIADRFPAPLRVADVGGGKGFLTYLLRQAGYDATVVDPHVQALPTKFKDLATGQRRRIPATHTVPRIAAPFQVDHARDFELLVGLHAHGANLEMIEAARRFRCSCVLVPCCVIDEPASPLRNQSWFLWLVGRARAAGLDVSFFELGFKGQNIGLAASPKN